MKYLLLPRIFLFFFVFAQTFLLALSTPIYADEALPEEDTPRKEASGKRITDYIEMKPDFVTNIGTPGQKLSYLKAAVTLRASQTTTRAAVEVHMPRLRHELVILFSEQADADTLTSTEGQAALQEEAKKRLNTVLEAQQTGEQIDTVLFTTFVVQR